MAKTDPIGVRFDANEKTALERAAAADDRSQSALIRKVTVEWLTEHGWLANPAAPPQRSRAKPQVILKATPSVTAQRGATKRLVTQKKES